MGSQEERGAQARQREDLVAGEGIGNEVLTSDGRSIDFMVSAGYVAALG